MHARTTTITADPDRIDAGIADVRDNVMPAVSGMDGCVGLSMLCDRDSGRCIVTTAWESEEAMAATREAVRRMREQATEQFGAPEPEVREWEIAAMHRLHPAGDDSCARVTWSRVDPASVDKVLDVFRRDLIPRMDEMPGFCSLSLMLDRQTGDNSLTAVYADRRAMEASRQRAMYIRDEFRRALRMAATDVAEFDVVLPHLRVPELV
ncbi:antibiotic biosynthesis monooxygenase [Blastococcus sp. VKM Ac-2987]|uniref:antibiotic biosynthesis monooxygenase n=1 Tax=Blastococcus sp. VKM Ac-2987 TaxID=3004141 RepID=UPI0022ABC597|nr:antibiotic biosynthesis monooxygenase [Blastococcus sp. VKM Ac-2987]MCZ2859971.1 antibiotic biosynthesis monooxygenase [Blastococcus sp. VKM Ac-2987]